MSKQPSPWGEPRRYPTDDRDLPKEQRHDLIIYPGQDGDWYVATDHEGCRGVLSAVRLCTSGGASTACPGLTNAIAYRAMGGEVIETACPRPLPCVRLDQHHEDDCTPEPSAPADGAELTQLLLALPDSLAFIASAYPIGTEGWRRVRDVRHAFDLLGNERAALCESRDGALRGRAAAEQERDVAAEAARDLCERQSKHHVAALLEYEKQLLRADRLWHREEARADAAERRVTELEVVSMSLMSRVEEVARVRRDIAAAIDGEHRDNLVGYLLIETAKLVLLGTSCADKFSPFARAFAEVLDVAPVDVREGPFGAEIDALNAITDMVMKSGGSGSPREWLRKICSVGLRALAAAAAKGGA